MRKVYVLSLLMVVFIGASLKAQTDLIISEYIEGWSNNKALEIYNPTNSAITLSNYRLVRYSNGSNVPPADATWAIILPEEVLKPYKAYVLVLDKRDPEGSGQEAPVWEQLVQRADVFLCPNYNVSNTMYFNGDDAVAIEKKDGETWSIIDLFGRYGAPRPEEAALPGGKTARAWSDTAPYFSGTGKAITADHTLVRKSSVSAGVTSNPAIFNPLAEYDTLSANIFDHLGWHKFDGAPANATPELNGELSFTISPSTANGTVITTLAAEDEENDPLRYYIDYGNFIYVENTRYEPFSINRETGAISLVDARGLVPEVLATFNLKIYVTDGYSQSEEKTVQINVSVNAAIKQTVNSTLVNVYPNPIAGKEFSVSATNAISELILTNLMGQQIQSNSYSSAKQVTFNFNSSTQQGIFLLTVKFSNGQSTVKKIQLQ